MTPVPAVAVRRAEAADVDEVVALGALATEYLDGGRGAEYMLAREAPAPTFEEVSAWLSAGDTAVFVGTLDDSPVGAAVARIEILAGGQRLAMVPMLIVRKEAREVSVGEELLGAVIAWARANDCDAVNAYALPGERETKNFFEANGFKARLLTVHHKL